MNEDKYLQKWIEGSLDEKEQEAFESSELFQWLGKVSKASLSLKAAPFDVEHELSRLKVRKTDTTPQRVLWLAPIMKVAAILTLIAFAYYLMFWNTESLPRTFYSDANKELFLPDSSQYILNKGSELSYISPDWKANRLVSLEGEAYFEVKKGSKFKVQTSSGAIKVLGTKFNVKNRINHFEVTCYEGSVQVDAGDHSVILKPNQTYRIIEGKYEKGNLSSKEQPSWMSGESTFESVPLGAVMAEFERQYKVEIIGLKDFESVRYSGRFAHNDLDLAAKSIALPLNLSYKIEDKRIVFDRELEE